MDETSESESTANQSGISDDVSSANNKRTSSSADTSTAYASTAPSTIAAVGTSTANITAARLEAEAAENRYLAAVKGARLGLNLFFFFNDKESNDI